MPFWVGTGISTNVSPWRSNTMALWAAVKPRSVHSTGDFKTAMVKLAVLNDLQLPFTFTQRDDIWVY